MKIARCYTRGSLVSGFVQNVAVSFLLVAGLTLLAADAQANTLTVNCDTKGALSTINGSRLLIQRGQTLSSSLVPAKKTCLYRVLTILP